jgi:hypothetical protein
MSSVRADARAAAVTLLEAYRDDADVKLSVYPGRPRSVLPPHAFVDRLTERTSYPAGVPPQRTVSVEVVVVHGLFDSGEAVAQADAFADGFMDWITDAPHAAGGNRTLGVDSIDDEPDWVPDWLPPEKQGPYYATRVTLEVYDPG